MVPRILILLCLLNWGSFALADDLACQRCYRACHGVNDTDACIPVCQNSVCQPIPIDPFDPRNT